MLSDFHFFLLVCVVVVVVVGLDGHISKQRELTCGSGEFCCAGFC